MPKVEAMRLYVRVLEESVQVFSLSPDLSLPRPTSKPILDCNQTTILPALSRLPSVHIGKQAPAKSFCEARLGWHSPSWLLCRLEFLQPDWWLLSRGAALQKSSTVGSRAPETKKKQRTLQDLAVAGSWVSGDIGGVRSPTPRYEHAVALFRRKLYIIGGNFSELSYSCSKCNLQMYLYAWTGSLDKILALNSCSLGKMATCLQHHLLST